MKTLFVYHNLDGYIRQIEKHILNAFDELAITYESCYIEDYPQKQEQFEPIMTVFFHPNHMIYKMIKTIDQAKGHKLLWDMESPYESDIVFDMLPHIHYIFTSDKATAERLKKKSSGNTIKYVPHACDPQIHKPLRPEDIPYDYKSDFVLIGNAYKNRIKWLEANRDRFKDQMVTIIGVGYWGMEGFKNQRFIRKHIPESECVKFYNGAKTVLNIHRTNADLDMANRRGIEPEHLNNRFYEVAAMGVKQEVVFRDNMKEEIDLIYNSSPSQYSYIKRVRDNFVPLLNES